MKKVRKKAPRPTLIPGTVHANIQLPAHLHDAMKSIRRRRSESELADVKLSRIYREAVEQYVNARPQQQLLNGETDELRNTA